MTTACSTRINWILQRKRIAPSGVKLRTWLSGCGEFRLEEHKQPSGDVMYRAYVRVPVGEGTAWEEIGGSYCKQDLIRGCESQRSF